MRLLLRGGVTESGVRLLSEKTLRYATLNHLPSNQGLETLGASCTIPRNACYRRGQGFTLINLSVIIDPAGMDTVCSEGELAWSSFGYCYMWIDPREDLGVLMLTQ